MQPATSYLLTLLSIGLVQLLAVISAGPSFLITARTAVAQSRADGVKVALSRFQRGGQRMLSMIPSPGLVRDADHGR
jgi:hypothetical protein